MCENCEASVKHRQESMTARTPEGRAAELARKAYRETGDCANEMGEHANCFDITKHIQNAISQAVDEALEAAMNICDTTYPCNDPAHDDRWCQRCSTMRDHGDFLEQKILKLKATYAKGEKHEFDSKGK